MTEKMSDKTRCTPRGGRCETDATPRKSSNKVRRQVLGDSEPYPSASRRNRRFSGSGGSMSMFAEMRETDEEAVYGF